MCLATTAYVYQHVQYMLLFLVLAINSKLNALILVAHVLLWAAFTITTFVLRPLLLSSFKQWCTIHNIKYTRYVPEPDLAGKKSILYQI